MTLDNLYPLVDRLRCNYNGRDFGGPMEVVLPTGIMLEAAARIAELETYIKDKDQVIFSQQRVIAELETQLKDNHDRAEEIISAREKQIHRLHDEIKQLEEDCKVMAGAILRHFKYADSDIWDIAAKYREGK